MRAKLAESHVLLFSGRTAARLDKPPLVQKLYQRRMVSLSASRSRSVDRHAKANVVVFSARKRRRKNCC